MKYKVSVILPCYNAEGTLHKTLESINSQHFKNFELVIINDGSKDSTLDIIKSFSFRKDISLLVISRGNKGFLHSLEEGIKTSSGDLIARIDADDIWEDNHLNLATSMFIEDCSLALVGSNATVIDKYDSVIRKTHVPCKDHEIRKALLNDNVFIHSSVVFKRELYKKTIGYACGNDEMAMHISDYNLWVELSKFGSIANIEECTVKYRFLNNSMSRTVNRVNNYRARLKIQNKAYRVYKKHFFYHLYCVSKTFVKIVQSAL